MHLDQQRFAALVAKINDNSPASLIVDCSFDQLELEQIQALLCALAQNSTCYSLKLNVNSLDLAACELIAEYLAKNPSIKLLELSGNNIDSDAACLIFQALIFNNILQYLVLKDNCIDDDAIYHILQLCNLNEDLRRLDLSFNKFSLDGLLQLTENSFKPDRIITTGDKLNNHNIEQIIHKKINKFFMIVQDTLVLISDNEQTQQINLLDLFNYASLSSFQQQIELQELFRLCLHYSDLCTKLISLLFKMPKNAELDTLWSIVGNNLFNYNMHDHADIIIYKIYTHICFVSIQQKCDSDKRLMLENYRSLVANSGLITNLDFHEWKKSYAEYLPYPITKIADKLITEIFSRLNQQQPIDAHNNKKLAKPVALLHTFRYKAMLQRELVGAIQANAHRNSIA